MSTTARIRTEIAALAQRGDSEDHSGRSPRGGDVLPNRRGPGSRASSAAPPPWESAPGTDATVGVGPGRTAVTLSLGGVGGTSGARGATSAMASRAGAGDGAFGDGEIGRASCRDRVWIS